MRAVLILLACLMLVVTAWSGAAQAADFGCGEMADQAAVHIASDCDEVSADADRGYPHCHTGCHGHHVAAPVSTRPPGRIGAIAIAYAPAAASTIAAHRGGQHLRPPQA